MRVIRRCVLGVAWAYTAGAVAARLLGLPPEAVLAVALNGLVAWALYGMTYLMGDDS